MGCSWFTVEQLCLSWIILSAVCVSCQELTSNLREGNRTCPGEEVIFTCTIRGPSTTLPVLVLVWSSDEYISRSLQLSTANMLGDVEISTGMDGNITATATVTNIANVNGERILECTLRITAIEPSTVTCSGTDIGTTSISFSISVVPGVPQMISAAEISRLHDNICIVLVTWDPPANSDAADIAQYIVYVPSRNIEMTVSSSSLSTLTVPNCGDDIHVQVAAMSHVGCVGMNSSEVQLTLLDIPTAPTGNGSTTTEGGSAQTFTSVTAVASVAVVLSIILCFVVLGLVLFGVLYKRGKKIQIAEQVPVLSPEVLMLEEHVESETRLIDALQNIQGTALVKRSLEELYNALKLKLPSRKMQAAARELKTTLMLGRDSSRFNENVKEAFISCLEALQSENDEIIQRVTENLDNTLTGMTGIDEEFKTSVRLLRTKIGTGEHKKVLDKLIKKMEIAQPSSIMSNLLSLCEKLRNVRQIKDYYCKQSKHDFGDLGTEEDRVSVPIWIDDELDDSWKASLREAMKAINEAAPGLSLSITDNKKKAIIHVLAINKEQPYTEVEGNILMRLKEKNFVTKIHLGKWKNDGKKGVCIHELLHALGFHHEHQDAITNFKYIYHLDSGKEITIDKSELGFIWWDSLSTTLYPCEQKCREHSEGHVCIWVLEAYPTKVNTEPDELDRIGLNLVYPPCIDKTDNDFRYKPKLGKTGMYYCGRIEVVLNQNDSQKGYTCPCGPDNGPNCSACRTIKNPRVEEILEGGRWQGVTGRVYCGRPFAEPAQLFPTHDGMCGMGNGPACRDCNDILNKELVQSASDPLALVQ